VKRRIWLVVGCFGKRKKFQFQDIDLHSLPFPLMGIEMFLVGLAFLSLTHFSFTLFGIFHTNKLVVMCQTIGSNSFCVGLMMCNHKNNNRIELTLFCCISLVHIRAKINSREAIVLGKARHGGAR
jgi:hypothetical protein